MTRSEAIGVLSSGSSHERLKAARLLGRTAILGDLAALRQARQTESVSYVKASLDRAIARLCELPAISAPDPAGEFEVPEELKRQIRTRAIEWIAGLLLHEIASPIGLVRRSASREIAEYEKSKTKRHLDAVQKIFEAIEQLKGAAAVPKPEEFDLADMLNDIAAAEMPEPGNVAISLIGPKPFVIVSDPALVRLAIANGIRNAIEAVTGFGTSTLHPVVVTWGMTDVDYWVAVLDQGHGIVGPVESAFEIGKSTKKGHSGFGLAIARQALETMGGTVLLRPGADGGARYEARWERP